MCTMLAVLFLGLAPVCAQNQDPPYTDTACGTWVNDVWVPNGNCSPEGPALRHGTVTGTIIAVSGHLVTVQRSAGAIVINDQPALERQQTGKVATGRMIVAYGFWRDGTFYATAIY
jgi:hypothetical protein